MYASSEELHEGDVIQARYMYITDIRPTIENVSDLLVYGRDRWTIEENFRNAKLGPLKMEHLRSLDSNAMEVYFWIEQIAAVLVHLYIYHSGILKIAGSQKEVFEILRDSFKSQCLEDHAEELSASKRICLRNRDPEHHCFPLAKIIEMNPPRKEGKGKISGHPKAQKGGNRKSNSKKAGAKETGKTAVKESGKKSVEKPEKTADGSEEVKKDYTVSATVREEMKEGEYSKVTDIRYSPSLSTSDKGPSAAVYKVQGKSELPHKSDPEKVQPAKSGGECGLRTGSGHGGETDIEPLDGKGIREGDSEQRVPA